MDLPYHKRKPQIVFIQSGKNAVKIACSRYPQTEMFRLDESYYEQLNIIGSWDGDTSELTRVYEALAPHHIRNHWYAPSPEVLAMAVAAPATPLRGKLNAVGNRQGIGGGPKLSSEQVIEIFRMAHKAALPYRMIGARYGVGAKAVGHIARGQSYMYLFRRTPVKNSLDYYISEDRDDAPKFKMTLGKRRGHFTGKLEMKD